MRSTRATAAALVAASPVPKARTENERALESWYTYFSHPPDEATCSKRFDRAGGVSVAEIINSIAAYETGRRRGVCGDFSITNRQVCGFLDKKEADEPHRVRRIGVKGDKKQAPAFMITTAKSRLPPRGKHRVTVDGKTMKKLAAAAATAAALKVSMALALTLAPRPQSHTIPLPQDENEQLKVDKMDATAATALLAGPAEEPLPPPPPTEVKAESGHRYAPNFMLAMAELFSIAKGLSVAAATLIIPFITYFMLLELWRIRTPWLCAEPALADIINITPSDSTIGGMRRYAGDVRDCAVTCAIAAGRFLVFDDGNKKGIKRKAILLVG